MAFLLALGAAAEAFNSEEIDNIHGICFGLLVKMGTANALEAYNHALIFESFECDKILGLQR